MFNFLRKKRPDPLPPTPPDYDVVARKLDAIEAEMKRINLWSATPPTPEQFQYHRAFAGDTMAFDQWLQFVFVPNVRAIIASRGPFPPSSSVGAYAVREWDTMPYDVSQLETLLIEFDRLFI
jgi:uncharacterized protein YqcC (DUF446 family)